MLDSCSRPRDLILFGRFEIVTGKICVPEDLPKRQATVWLVFFLFLFLFCFFWGGGTLSNQQMITILSSDLHDLQV